MKTILNKLFLSVTALLISTPAFTDILPGLWLGVVEVKQVNEVFHRSTNKTVPKDVKYPFNLQILLHTDENGKTKMLREVYIMQTKGTLNKKRVLITDVSKIKDYEGIIRRGDNKLAAVRFVSPSFDFGQDALQQTLLLEGSVNNTNNSKISGSLSLSSDHPINPMKHQYSPDHKEGFSVKRDFSMTIKLPVAGSNTKPNEGKTFLKGIYEESITGLHKEVLKVSGDLQLNRVNSIAVLNAASN